MWVAWLFFSKPHPKPLQNKDKVLLKMKKKLHSTGREKKKTDILDLEEFSQSRKTCHVVNS